MGASWARVHPVLRQRALSLCAEAGCYLVSGHRTWDEQNYLYQGWVNRRPGFAPANPPGRSCHEARPGRGSTEVGALAVDLGGNLVRARQIARKHGIHFNVGGEPWHAQPIEIASSQWTGWGPLGPPAAQPPPPPPPRLVLLEDDLKTPMTPRDPDNPTRLDLVWAESDRWDPYGKAIGISHLRVGLLPAFVDRKENWGKTFEVTVWSPGMGTKKFTLGAGVDNVPSTVSFEQTGNGPVTVIGGNAQVWGEHILQFVPKP